MPRADRWLGLRERLLRSGCDGLLVVAGSSSDIDLTPFVGRAHLGRTLLALPAAGEPTLAFLTDMEREEAATTGHDLATPEDLDLESLRQLESTPGRHWAAVISRLFATRDRSPGRWALAGHAAAGGVVEACQELAESGWQWCDGGEMLREWRKDKRGVEEVDFRAPAAGVCAAMRVIAGILAAADVRESALWSDGAALTVGALRNAAAREYGRRGLSQPEGNIFALGAEAGVPHTQGGSTAVVAPGVPLVVDMYPRGVMFADCTRTFCVGEPPAGFAEAFALVLDALENAHRNCRPGITGFALQERTCDLFEGAGYPTPRSDPATTRGYVHGLGHGVGFELHEYPSFREGAGEAGKIAPGDLLTLEPGLYEPEAGFGMRLEDLCYVGESGVENLTPLPYEWDPALWDV